MGWGQAAQLGQVRLEQLRGRVETERSAWQRLFAATQHQAEGAASAAATLDSQVLAVLEDLVQVDACTSLCPFCTSHSRGNVATARPLVFI